MPDLTVEEKEETEAIRKTLVKRALEYASENELVVIPQATYVTTQFLPEHPQYLHLLKKRARDRLLRKLHENR